MLSVKSTLFVYSLMRCFLCFRAGNFAFSFCTFVNARVGITSFHFYTLCPLSASLEQMIERLKFVASSYHRGPLLESCASDTRLHEHSPG